MSKMIHPLLCSVNHIIGLFLSKRYEVIPLLIWRAAKHIERFPAPANAVQYYEVVGRYLAQMAYFLQAHTAVEECDLRLIPDYIRSAGSQEAPPFPFRGSGVLPEA